MTINQHYMFHMRFLSPTDQKCAESPTHWQFFYYRQPVNSDLHTWERSWKCYAKNLTYMYIYIYCIYMTLLIIDMDFFYINSSWDWLHHFSQFVFMTSLKKKVFKNSRKLAGLWLVGEVDDHVVIYGSKMTEGFSAFQRRSRYIVCIPAMADSKKMLFQYISRHISTYWFLYLFVSALCITFIPICKKKYTLLLC